MLINCLSQVATLLPSDDARAFSPPPFELGFVMEECELDLKYELHF